MKTSPIKLILLLLAAFVLPAAPALCQTTVSGTVVDPNGNPYASGTASAYKVVPTGQPAGTPTNVATSASGLFTMSLASPASYLFTLCAAPVNIGPTTNPTPKQLCFTSQPIAVSGATQDISATLNALAVQLGPVGAAGNVANPSFNSITVGAGGNLAGTFSGNPTASGNWIFSGSPSFTGTLQVPAKADPASPLVGEFWVNLGIGRFRDNAATPATHQIATSLAGACAANNWVNAITNDAAPSCAQPAASNLSNGTTGSGAVVLATSPTLLGSPVLSAVGGNATLQPAASVNATITFPGATSTLPGVVYNTASASTNAAIGLTTMATAGASGNTYKFGAYVTQTAAGTGCTGTTTIAVNLTFSDPNGGSITSAIVTAQITGNGSPGPVATLAQGSGFPIENPFRAAASTAVQYQTFYTLGTGCGPTTGPSYRVHPILEQVQ